MLNEEYLDKKTIKEMMNAFDEEGVLLLEEFLEEEAAENIREEIEKLKYLEEYNPLTHRRKKAKELPPVLNELLNSEAFTSFIKTIIEKEPAKGNLYQFGHKDFTLLHDEREEIGKNEFFIILDFSDEFEEVEGGTLKFCTKEEELLLYPPEFNTLIIVKKEKEVMDYLKYINNKAGDKKIFRYEIRTRF